MEHLHHFQLAEDPFRSDPLEKFDLELPSQQDALARLDRGVRQGKGLVVLVGSVGAGKTRVARRLYDGLEEELFDAAMMVVLRREVGADWLLARIARQLQIEDVDGTEREALIAQIYEKLTIVHEDGRRMVLIIDDAHGLANTDALSEVCGLVKLEYEDRRLLTIVLIGSPPLDAALRADPLLAHHVDVRVALAPLERDEAAGYLAARIETAGGNPELLLPGASAALHELGEGAPGRMNVLADNALFEAWLAQRGQLTRSDVEQAHRNLAWDTSAAAPRTARAAAPRPATPRSRPQQAELTDPLYDAGARRSAAPDDPELDAVFEAPARSERPGGRGSAEAHRTVVMDFAAQAERTISPTRRGRAEATRVLVEEAPEPLDKRSGDEVDDLFMELLDD